MVRVSVRYCFTRAILCAILGQSRFATPCRNESILNNKGRMKQMRRFAAVIGCACALSYVFSAGAVLAGSPRGQIYFAHVFTSFGTEFDDCFFFSKTGKLNIDNYGTILYRFDALNTQANDWQAFLARNRRTGLLWRFMAM